MSAISTIYSSVVSRIETVLDVSTNGYRRIPNPYSVVDNAELNLRKGYGLAILPATNQEVQLNCKISISRQSEIILTRLYTGDDENAQTRAALELLLLEDQYKLINNIEQDASVSTSGLIMKFTGDSGIEYVSGESSRFFMLRTQFSLDYMELYT